MVYPMAASTCCSPLHSSLQLHCSPSGGMSSALSQNGLSPGIYSTKPNMLIKLEWNGKHENHFTSHTQSMVEHCSNSLEQRIA